MTDKWPRRFVVGTRAYYEKSTGDWRVICATCDAGGSVKHTTAQSAFDAAARDSDKLCRACGAH